jgi:hypothetical protein
MMIFRSESPSHTSMARACSNSLVVLGISPFRSR